MYGGRFCERGTADEIFYNPRHEYTRGLLRSIPNITNMKERLVQQYTNGRTSSLRAMSTAEYDALCDALERSTADPQHELRKKKRSAALRLMQQLGIDTTDWPRINAFCRDRRIAGKEFGALTPPELDALALKLRAIQRSGGLNPRPERPTGQAEQSRPQIIYMPLGGLPN